MVEQSITLNPGESRVVSFEASPKEVKEYQVVVDGLTGSFVVIAAVTPPATILAGVILDVKWRETGTTQWHPIPISVPEYTEIDIKWRVRNDSNGQATFTIGTISLGRYRLYPQTLVTLGPGEEADLIREAFRGWAAGTTGTETFYLAALVGTVTSTYQPGWYDADLVDSITVQFSWY